DRPQFRAGVELLQLDVAVLDDKREPVRGLTAADFTVLENGAVKPIRAFTPVEITEAPPAAEVPFAAGVPPDVTTNHASERDGRLVVILMDRTIPVQQPTVVARKIAAAAVEALGPDDLAAIVSTSNGAVQNLTNDRSRLLRAIAATDPSTGISPEQEAVFGKLDPRNDGRCLCGLCVLETMTRVAEAVESTRRRRKVLLFIGSNVVWQSWRPANEAGADPGCEVPLKDARNALFAAIDRAGLTVHSIDPQGLTTIGQQTRAGVSGSGLDSTGPQVRLRKLQTDITGSQTSLQSLQVLPERTGGRTVANSNNPAAAIPAILRESQSYYVLGVERGTSDRADEARSIEVKVGRRGMRAYAQRKYVLTRPRDAAALAAQASAPPSAVAALNRLLPNGRLPLSLSVAPFASGNGAKAMARVNVDARAFVTPGGPAVPLEVAVLVVDQTGRPVASARQTSSVEIGTEGAGAASVLRDVNIESHVELAPGDYGVRVAVADPATGRVSSVFSDLMVPPFGTAPLSLSGLSIEVRTPSSGAAAATTRRVFRRAEQVRVLSQIYQGTQLTSPIVPVAMKVQILDAKGAAVRDQSLPFTDRMFNNRRADALITLPIANLPAGAYLLKLEASANQLSASRALRFAVE
ncbi:MAG TPA: VWA domain-containing protein, partial [Vicinamibacterales bacterium]|nr:VWA domain-containing protein [Vicinamibacterales bacterium]